MPTLVNLNDRETVDLHAPWWSNERDDQGRYKERVVIYAQMTERDEQMIARAIAPKVRPGQGRDVASITMDQTAFARLHLFLRMITEMTDAGGNRIPLTAETIAALPKKDSSWIQGEIDELNKSPIQPTPEDEHEAELLVGSSHEQSPTELAVGHFRRPRH